MSTPAMLEGVRVIECSLLGPAASLWELLAEPLTSEEVVATLADHYGVDADLVSPEIRATLDELLLRGALCRR